MFSRNGLELRNHLCGPRSFKYLKVLASYFRCKILCDVTRTQSRFRRYRQVICSFTEHISLGNNYSREENFIQLYVRKCFFVSILALVGQTPLVFAFA